MNRELHIDPGKNRSYEINNIAVPWFPDAFSSLANREMVMAEFVMATATGCYNLDYTSVGMDFRSILGLAVKTKCRNLLHTPSVTRVTGDRREIALGVNAVQMRLRAIQHRSIIDRRTSTTRKKIFYHKRDFGSH